jgi:hypothetical protein
MKPLADKKGVLVEEPEYFGAQSFSAEAAGRFPELISQLALEAGRVHVQMGTLASAVRAGVDSGDLALASRVFTFLSEILSKKRLHPELQNAIAISFLAPFEFEQPGRWTEAWALMPKPLQNALRE